MMKTNAAPKDEVNSAEPAKGPRHNFARRVSDQAQPRPADLAIASAAKKIVRWLSVVPTNTVRVSVDRGWITLSGEVEYFHQQAAATLALRNLSGVIGIFNHIQVHSPVSSAVIKAGIESALHNSTLDERLKIIVSVEGTDVTLSGEIDSWTERSMANHFAWGMAGVSHVVDHMTMSF